MKFSRKSSNRPASAGDSCTSGTPSRMPVARLVEMEAAAVRHRVNDSYPTDMRTSETWWATR